MKSTASATRAETACLLGLLGLWSCGSPPLRLEVSSLHIPANGRTTREVRAAGGRGDVRLRILEGKDLVETVFEDEKSIVLRAGLRPGRVKLQGTDGATESEITLLLHPDPADEDRDGFPDVAELRTAEERAAFRARFVATARSQALEPDPRWEEAQRDCAGLVRHAYREALRETASPGVEEQVQTLGPAGWGRLRFAFPEIPFLGDRPFRLATGWFSGAEDAGRSFGPFADAKHLLLYNASPLGKDERAAEDGDLLFFFHPEESEQPYHVMVYFRRESQGWLIYHTGTTPGGRGRMKEIPLHRLRKHPDPSWHPRSTNERFLGFYRLRILA